MGRSYQSLIQIAQTLKQKLLQQSLVSPLQGHPTISPTDIERRECVCHKSVIGREVRTVKPLYLFYIRAKRASFEIHWQCPTHLDFAVRSVYWRFQGCWGGARLVFISKTAPLLERYTDRLPRAITVWSGPARSLSVISPRATAAEGQEKLLRGSLISSPLTLPRRKTLTLLTPVQGDT